MDLTRLTAIMDSIRAVVDDAAKKVYRASKGGWLPGQGTVATFSTGDFGFVIAQNGDPQPGVTTPW